MTLHILYSENGSRSKRDHTNASRNLHRSSCVMNTKIPKVCRVLCSFGSPLWSIFASSWCCGASFYSKLTHKKFICQKDHTLLLSSLLVKNTFWLRSLQLIDHQVFLLDCLFKMLLPIIRPSSPIPSFVGPSPLHWSSTSFAFSIQPSPVEPSSVRDGK